MIRRPPRSTLFPYTTLFRSPTPRGEYGESLRKVADLVLDLEREQDERCTVGIGTPGRVSRSSTDRKSTRLNSSHGYISYAVFCLKKKTNPCVPPQRDLLTEI